MIESSPDEQQASPLIIPGTLKGGIEVNALHGISMQDLERPQGLLDKSVPYAAAVSMSLESLATTLTEGAQEDDTTVVQFGEVLQQLDTLSNWIEFLKSEQERVELPAGADRIPAQVQLLQDIYDAIASHDGKIPTLLLPMLYDDVTALSDNLHQYVKRLGGTSFATTAEPLPVDTAGLIVFVQQAQRQLEQLQERCEGFLKDDSSDRSYQERISELQETLGESQSFLRDVLSIVASASSERESAVYETLQKRLQSFFVSASGAATSEGPEVEVISKRRLRMMMPVLEKAALYLETKERELAGQLLH